MNTSECPGRLRSGPTITRPWRSRSAPSPCPRDDALTPAAHRTVRHGRRSVPMSRPSASMFVTRLSLRICTPRLSRSRAARPASFLGSPKVHVGPELAEGAPGGPVTGAFPGFSLGVLVMGQGPVEARGKRAVFSKARWARLCVRGAGSFHRACPFVTSGPRVDLLHLPRVQLVKSRCPYDLRCTCVIFQPERWGPNSQTLAPLRVRAHRGDHAL